MKKVLPVLLSLLLIFSVLPVAAAEEVPSAPADYMYLQDRDKMLRGDANLDMTITIDDAEMIKSYHKQEIELNPEAQYVSDVNADGVIDILDATFIERYLGGEGNLYNVGYYMDGSNVPDPTDPPTEPVIPTDKPTDSGDIDCTVPTAPTLPFDHDKAIRGDVNFDGTVDMTDADLIKDYLQMKTTLSDDAKVVADVDGDGTITIVDATYVERYVNGEGNPYNVGYYMDGSNAPDPTDPIDPPTEPVLPTEPETESLTDGTIPFDRDKAIRGDVNFDGTVDMTDAELIKDYLQMKITLSEDAKVVADVDGDGTITIVDATCVERYVNGEGNPYSIGYYMDGSNVPKPETLTDKDSGISVSLNEDKGLTLSVSAVDIDDVSLLVTGIGKALAVYNISLLDENVAVQTDNSVTVRIPCDNPNAKVYRVEADNSLTDLNAVYEDGYLVFTTDHFSLYIVAEESAPILGDADGDGKVTVLDATAIQRKLADLSVADSFNLTAACVSGGELSIIDATYIQRHLVDLSVPYAIGEPIKL